MFGVCPPESAASHLDRNIVLGRTVITAGRQVAVLDYVNLYSTAASWEFRSASTFKLLLFPRLMDFATGAHALPMESEGLREAKRDLRPPLVLVLHVCQHRSSDS